MLKLLFTISLVSIFFADSYSQSNHATGKNEKSPYLIRSSLGSNGLSRTLVEGSGSYYVSQSIGQQSVIGTFTNNKYTIRQGFQQPLISISNAVISEENSLKAKLYPNPFYYSVNVVFEEDLESELNVVIYNLSGSVLHSSNFSASKMINIPLNSLPNGDYFIKITTQNKQLISKIIKH